MMVSNSNYKCFANPMPQMAVCNCCISSFFCLLILGSEENRTPHAQYTAESAHFGGHDPCFDFLTATTPVVSLNVLNGSDVGRRIW